MIRNILYSSKHVYGKQLFYPKYGTSYYDSLNYARIISNAKSDDKYDVEKELWTVEEPPAARGGSEVNVNNPRVRPSE
tara:strand:- start:1159 stop:1392 length:234 start_codon:yes stop_codon:yes gene_type:complete